MGTAAADKMMSVVSFYALVVGAVACFYDLRSARIPNWLTFGAAAVALVFHTFASQGLGLGAAVFGLLVGLALFFPIFALRAMGAGDVKLLATFGAWLGAGMVLWVAIYASIAGGVLALLIMAARGYVRQGFSNIRTLLVFWLVNGIRPLPAVSLDAPGAVRLPYALPITVGLVVTLWQQ